MSLEATHIKFALDVKEKFNVVDVQKYLVGTIYPDSRYISGIDRTLTHNDRLLDPDFMQTDFNKGWAVHYLCDRAGNRAMDELLPDLQIGLTERSAGTEWWVRATAIKNIQDILVLTECNIQPYLPMLDYVHNPNNEPRERVQEYNRLIQELYTKQEKFTEAETKKFWERLGVGSELVERVAQCTKKYQADSEYMDRIKELYPRMLEIFDHEMTRIVLR